ncbi:toll/interleukin-1 receptor domain-containing protein [Flavobacterium psychrophilum]|uniref:toll/interleukin-1 receptor domain-containing protein n=1 Tax=Flavobacterium psychrophilum TaxID=96345 RepID=UPI001C8F3BB5|nr:toll/interleukin-1 receptor domain-containing protein [Flavobacterium psychrophilum]EKT4548792.1 toll/interleukin-1 receptor domain-containing protein [Flavobacterium psychrophilum]ELM3649692.1 toll/interleukin-1 receptor domain-containing protein [Flavobacterium psychrophilum]ELM3671008.1 toll/interleukin-1 receptor domain-containing protein [Flavobacterium psychrophilum]ELM3725522.1 toll/interleukin-1 receptor domain-containing protein [Flavobacterium psychrophilum]ELY1991494.1 toll/inter
MKVFISWSGERSRLVAELLNNWIQCVLQAVDPWLSSKDIDRGSLWFSEITTQLSNTHNGIVCLTKSNLNKPWILFESGALAKGLSSNRVYTFLIDLNPNDIKDPLAQFNHTTPNRESVYQLIRSINNGLEENSLKENILLNVFDTYFPQFDRDFKQILKDTKDEEVIEVRPKEDILNEILYSVRGMDKRLRILEDNENGNIRKIDYVINNRKREEGFSKVFHIPLEEYGLTTKTISYLKSFGIDNLDDYIKFENNNSKVFPEMVRKEINSIISKIA